MDQTEKLVTIIELKKRGDSDEQAMRKLRAVRSDVTAAISGSHGLNVAVHPVGRLPGGTGGFWAHQRSCAPPVERAETDPVCTLRSSPAPAKRSARSPAQWPLS
jgi:hypothetical protein